MSDLCVNKSSKSGLLGEETQDGRLLMEDSQLASESYRPGNDDFQNIAKSRKVVVRHVAIGSLLSVSPDNLHDSQNLPTSNSAEPSSTEFNWREFGMQAELTRLREQVAILEEKNRLQETIIQQLQARVDGQVDGQVNNQSDDQSGLFIQPRFDRCWDATDHF